MSALDPRGQPPARAESPLREAAAAIGTGLDQILVVLTRIPWPAWAAIGAAVCMSTFPFTSSRREMVGLVLDDRLSLWLSRLVVVAVFAVILTVCFFLIRALFRFMELDRWPRKAAGVEIDEFARAQSRLAVDADEMSSAADTIRNLCKRMDEARDTIMLLRGELDRLRPATAGDTGDGAHRAQSE